MFQIDGRPLEINAKEIAEKMFETNVGSNTEQILKPAAEVDLHIENVSKTYWRLSNTEIFALQLKTFENHLEQSIASGLDNVVFIHGIGDGKLKSAIHQILAGHQNVSFFGKASEQKYGDGATLVRIK